MNEKIKITAIVAVDEECGIGKNGKMAWHVPEDFKHFKEYTKNSLCIMGSTTFKDIVSHKKQPDGDLLPGRTCMVLTKRPSEFEEKYKYTQVHFFSNGHLLKDLIYFSSISNNTTLGLYEKVCIIGGKTVYDLFFDILDELIVTRVKGTHGCDTHIDLQPYIDIATTVTGWQLAETEHTVELYSLDQQLRDI